MSLLREGLVAAALSMAAAACSQDTSPGSGEEAAAVAEGAAKGTAPEPSTTPEPSKETAEPTQRASRTPPPAEPEPPDPFAQSLPRVLERGIVPVEGEILTWDVDPFVAAWILDALETGRGEPYFVPVVPKPKRAKTGKTGKKGKKGTRARPAAVANARGWRVQKVEPDSVFHRLGLRNGDVVQRVGTTPARAPEALRAALRKTGDTLHITIKRRRETVTLRYRLAGGLAWRDAMKERTGRDVVTPSAGAPEPSAGSGGGKRPSRGGKAIAPAKPSAKGTGSTAIGPVPITCSGITCTVPKAYFNSMVSSSSKLRDHAKMKDHSKGYVLTWVRKDGAADKLHLRSGDVITKVNGRRLSNDFEAMSVYLSLGSTRKYVMDFLRGGKSQRRIVLVK